MIRTDSSARRSPFTSFASSASLAPQFRALEEAIQLLQAYAARLGLLDGAPASPGSPSPSEPAQPTRPPPVGRDPNDSFTPSTSGYAPNGYTTRGPMQVWPGRNPLTTPAGYIHSTSGQDVKALTPKPYDTWKPVQWAWANEKKPGNIQTVTGPGGVPAYRFQVGKNDDPMNLASHAPRSEFDQVDPEAQRLGVSPQKDLMITDKTGERFYKFGIYLPKDQFPQDQRWATLMQYHPDHKSNMEGGGGLAVHGKYLDFLKPFGGGGQTLHRMPLPTDKWTNIGLKVNWSSGKDGFMQWYVNGKPVGEAYHGPTVKAGQSVYLKQGYYRDYGTAHGTGVVYQTPMMEAQRPPASLG